MYMIVKLKFISAEYQPSRTTQIDPKTQFISQNGTKMCEALSTKKQK